MQETIEQAAPTRKIVGFMVGGTLYTVAFLIIGILLGRATVPATATGQPQTASTPVAAVELTTYASASDMYARLANSELPCLDAYSNHPPDGTFVGCSLSQHTATLRTFARTKLTTAADLPIRNREGQKQLVITGRNWEVHITADDDPQVNRLLAERVATALGGRIISAG